MGKKAYYVLALIAVGIVTLSVTAWAKTYTFQATSLTPGATGTVDVKADKTGGNTNVSITVDHLARPTLLSPPANECVVWIDPEDRSPQNQGVLRVGDNQKGSFENDHHIFQIQGNGDRGNRCPSSSSIEPRRAARRRAGVKRAAG